MEQVKNVVVPELSVQSKEEKEQFQVKDEEMKAIRDLISSEKFDPNVKGGLRWPLAKANSGGQYRVIVIWHTKIEAYNSSSTRLKLREVNRFNFRETAGEVTRDVNLMLIGSSNNVFAVVLGAIRKADKEDIDGNHVEIYESCDKPVDTAIAAYYSEE
ncbi:putative L-type lectin-domain containing receptor kinase I.10, partial [Bienertia sinuspersici]